VQAARAAARDSSVDAVRGIAIVLMVMGHVIGSDGSRGLSVPDDSFLRFVYIALEDIRMPLFTLVSGYLYAFRPVGSASALPAFARHKAGRLLVPMLSVSTLFFLVRQVVPASNARDSMYDWWRIHVFPYEHFWFLQAILIVLMVVALLDVADLLSSVMRWSAVVIGSIVVYVAVAASDGWTLLSLNGAVRLFPFFLLGVGLARFRRLEARPVVIVAGILLGVAYPVRLADAAGVVILPQLVDRLLSVAIGAGALVLIFAARRRITSRLLVALGSFSFAIYLFHVFGTAGARSLLGYLGVDQVWAVLPISLIAGLVMPVVLELVVGRLPVIRRLLLGQRAAPQALAARWGSARAVS
jgi:fucose 4-O-acetylase-like acetyltransferase